MSPPWILRPTLLKHCVKLSRASAPSIVDIGHHLPCTGEERSLDDSIKVVGLDKGILWVYSTSLCKLPLFCKRRSFSESKSNLGEDSTCVLERSAVAALAYYDTSSEAIYGACAFNSSEARSRCVQRGFDICHQYRSVLLTDCVICYNCAGYFWSSIDCNVYAIVDEQGKVAISRW